ncbi:PhoH family protein [Candidatus Dependentiae bacterium]|nr:PhoH family protein [Candidatus Dependentiae bacterium]
MTSQATGQGRTFNILDTNVLMYDPEALFKFEKAHIGISIVVLEELDKFKQEATDKGRNTRAAIRYLDSIRTKGCLGEGIELPNGSLLKVLFTPMHTQKKTFPFETNIGDHRILLTALELKQKGHDVRFISKDINARLKADALGIQAQDYLKQALTTHDTFYKGWISIAVPAVELKKEMPAVLLQLLEEQEITVNQFILLKSQNNPYNYVIFRYCGGEIFKRVTQPQFKWPIHARNPQQLMALDLLLDDNIKLVSLCGPAGTGKTFLALLAGLHKLLVKDAYEKMLISRPVVPLGRDIGYLPGTLEEKLHSWMLPIYDNIECIFHSVRVSQHLEEVKQENDHKGNGRRKSRKKQNGGINGLRSLNDLVYQGKLSLEAITYMRGRSIPYQYILIDEVQNLSLHEVKTLVSRVGDGGKIILSGDPYQIDSQYLDFSSNGLVVTSERFKGQEIFGTVYLETSERSELSKLASELL